MANAALNVRNYICHCTRQANVAAHDPAMPAGWELRTVRKFDGGSFETALCDDCVAFENSLSPAEVDILDGRSHDSSSAINDEPAKILGCTKSHRLWQIRLIFHSDKGAVESTVLLAAENPVAAAKILPMISRHRMDELVSIIITPAPVDVLSPLMTGGGMDACLALAASTAASPADRMMRPKRHVWPMDGMHR